jgi:hypothetical protein
MSIKKIAREYRFKIFSGVFDELNELLGGDPNEESYWERQEREQKAQEEGNKKILEKVKHFVDSFSNPGDKSPLDEYDEEEILEYNPKYASEKTRDCSLLFRFEDDTILNLSAKVNMDTGEIFVENLRIVGEKNISEELKNVVNSVTNAPLEYYAPDKSWIYDAQINGHMEEGDTRMVDMAKQILKLYVEK